MKVTRTHWPIRHLHLLKHDEQAGVIFGKPIDARDGLPYAIVPLSVVAESNPGEHVLEPTDRVKDDQQYGGAKQVWRLQEALLITESALSVLRQQLADLREEKRLIWGNINQEATP